MSILEKLKDLVASLETEREVDDAKQEKESTTPPPLPPEPEKEEIQVEESDIEEIAETPDYLDCSEPDSLSVSSLIEEVKEMKIKLAEAQLRFEKEKASIVHGIARKNQEILSKLESLRLEYGIPQEGYSVELPSSREDRVSFRKED